MTVGGFVLEGEVLKYFLAVQEVVEVLGNLHRVLDGCYGGFYVEMLEGHADREQPFKGLLAYVAIVHGLGVIEGQHDVIVPFAGFCPPQPDLVFPVVGCDERDYFLKVQLLPCLVISSILRLVQWLQYRLELLLEDLREQEGLCDQVRVPCKVDY